MDHDLQDVGRTTWGGRWTRCGVAGCGIGSGAGSGGRNTGFMRRRRCWAGGWQGLCSGDMTREDWGAIWVWTRAHGRRRRVGRASPGGAHLTSVRGKCRRGDGERREGGETGKTRRGRRERAASGTGGRKREEWLGRSGLGWERRAPGDEGRRGRGRRQTSTGPLLLGDGPTNHTHATCPFLA